HVELADTKGVLDLNSNFTIETWLRLPENLEPEAIIAGDLMHGADRLPDSAFGGWSLVAIKSDTMWRPRVAVAYGVNNGGGPLGKDVNPLDWHHFAVVNDENSLSIYVDGIRQGTGSGRPQLVNSPVNVYLGMPKEMKRTGRSFEGDMKAFRISSK